MPTLPPDFYARRRAEARPPAVLREGDLPPERWLQQIWRHQRIRRGELRSLDGQPVRVLHPGFWNHEPGPDFKGAVIQIGTGPAKTGDVEIDLAVSGWRGHRHEGNPAYAGVILHVVWEAVPRDLVPPVLAIRPFLDAPVAELGAWLEDGAAGSLPPEVLGRCCAPLRDVPADALAGLLGQAAHVRLRRKAGEFAARARHVGWDGALWEGLFAALGYKHNVWPMRRLAELVVGTSQVDQAVTIEARLLGLSGLLPAQLPRGSDAGHIRTLWDIWWRERDRWGDLVLPASLWRLAGIRPANHPQRRLALAARWLASGDLVPRLEAWLTAGPDMTTAPARLTALLAPVVEPDGFWSRHWTLRSAALAAPQPMLGTARTTDIAVNVVLPWFLARAETGRDPSLPARLANWYETWPASEDNAVLRLARQRLFGGGARRMPRTAAAQQGLLQVSRDFCGPAGALCEGCRFPDIVRAMPR